MDEIVRLTIKPHNHHSPSRTIKYQAWLGAELIVTSHQPLFDGARVLLDMGYNPSRLITTRQDKNQYDNFVPVTIGYASGRSCDEHARAFTRYIKYADATPL